MASARIQSALARIEKAAAPRAADGKSADPESDRLARRNAALENAVRNGLAELDDLIEKLEK